MERFIRCIVHADFQALIVSGKAGNTKLESVWANILQQYIDCIGSHIRDIHAYSQARIDVLEKKHNKIINLIEGLPYQYSPTAVETINQELNSTFLFDRSNREGFTRDLEAAGHLALAYRRRWLAEKGTLDIVGLYCKNPAGWAPEEFYNALFHLLSISFNRLIGSEISVYEFCDHLRLTAKCSAQWTRSEEID